MSLLKYFLYKAKNKGSSSSSLLSLSVSLPTRVPSLSQELEVTNGFVDKAVTATTVSTASRRKYYWLIYPVERAAIGMKYTAENGPSSSKYKLTRHF